MKKVLKKVWNFVIYPYTWYKRKQEVKKRIAELRKRDPFIYK
jgi:hypothetical protein